MIIKYHQFINEGLKEIINFRQIKVNDQIAKKYIDMMYADYENKKDLLQVFIVDDSLSYHLHDDPFLHAGTNLPEGGLDIKLNRNSSGISGGEISVEIFIPRRGTNPIFGRSRSDGKIIFNDKGITENIHEYINISQSIVDKALTFFRKEYVKKYPELGKNIRHLNPNKILDIDKDLFDSRIKKIKDLRIANEIEYTKKKEYNLSYIEKNSKYTSEDIEDFFLDLSDSMCNLKCVALGYYDGVDFNYTNHFFTKYKSISSIDNKMLVDLIDYEYLKEGIYYIVMYNHPYIEMGLNEDKIIKFLNDDKRIKNLFEVISTGYGRGKEKNILSEVCNSTEYGILLRQK